MDLQTSELEGLDSLREAHVAALNAGDGDAWVACFTADAVQMPPNAPANVGAENIRGWSGGMLAAFSAEFALSPEIPTGRPRMGLRTRHVHDHSHPKVR